MEIDYLETAKIILPIIAIVVSALTIYFTRKNVKKQIRVNKLEEILEVVYLATRDYRFLFMIISDMRYVEEKRKTNEFVGEGYLNYPERIDEYIKNVNEEKLRDKMARLQVLVTAYVPNKGNDNLQFKLMALAELKIYMYQVIFAKELIGKSVYYERGIPKPGAFGRHIQTIEEGLIKEMGLGHKHYSYDKYKQYLESTFLKDMDLKKPS